MFGKVRIGTICYYVSDIARTEAFYRDVLGLEVANMGDDGSGKDWLTATTEGGLELIFFQTESRPGNSPIIVFDLKEGGIDTAVAALAEKGATIVTPVSHAPGGGQPTSPTRMATCFPCTSPRTRPGRRIWPRSPTAPRPMSRRR